jgi:hypothetical protein
VVLSLCSFSSYSEEYIYETSGNAAQNGLDWVMKNVLPQYTGLAVNGVVYQYTTLKDTDADLVVTVSNENAQVPGQYIFRSRDDWSGVPQNTIKRGTSIPYVGAEYWGNGSIEVDGEGEVLDASVFYTYRYDEECAVNPQTKPSCPGFVMPEIVIPESFDPLDDDIVQNELDRKRVAMNAEDQENRDRERSKDKKDKEREMIEVLLGTTNTTELAGSSQLLYEKLLALDWTPQSYYKVLPTTVYEEVVLLQDSVLPDNKKARRVVLAQEVLHDRMTELQYQLGEKK